MQLSPFADLSFDITDNQFIWKPLVHHRTQPGSSLRQWLLDQGSLTNSLILHSDNQFRVDVVAENWITIDAPELREKFGPLDPGHRFWSRKVILFGRQQAWVAAHTLVPEHGFHSPLRRLLELNTRPLGEYLFSHPELLRCAMDFSPIDPNAWGRRSLFYLHRKPVMVAEFFLPRLCDSLS